LVITLGLQWKQDFWLLDLATGHRRQLTNLRPESRMQSFDVSPDGKQIVFDRYRENSDIVLIDLKR
jgi:Tol biopolymer transport system component